MHSNGPNASGMNRNDLSGLRHTLGTSNHLMGGHAVINLLVLEKKGSHYTLTMLLGDTSPYWDQSSKVNVHFVSQRNGILTNLCMPSRVFRKSLFVELDLVPKICDVNRYGELTKKISAL